MHSLSEGKKVKVDINNDGAYILLEGNLNAFYELTCNSEDCLWTTMDQELEVPRYAAVAMYLPPEFPCEEKEDVMK